ncbi:hypothetical protein [Vulcanococcus sp.]|uniref:hypothetical protein n=1 Tax=Vulcanococcus sp. TaxID=2856995 RepID=UPI003F6A41E9
MDAGADRESHKNCTGLNKLQNQSNKNTILEPENIDTEISSKTLINAIETAAPRATQTKFTPIYCSAATVKGAF